MPALYAAVDVFVLPTIYDPFSNACLEALAAGLPVLTTTANGFAEILTPGVTGDTFTPGRMLLFRAGDRITLRAGPTGARILLLGGAAMDGPRHLFWNFVSSSRDRIEQAKQDWRARRFPAVPSPSPGRRGEGKRRPRPGPGNGRGEG